MSEARRVPWTICFDRIADYAAVRQQAVRAYRIFRSDPSHPSLHFKKLEGEENIYSVRIGLAYRALGAMKGNRIVWFWIGSHGDYDRMI